MNKKRKNGHRKKIWLILSLLYFAGAIIMFINRSGVLNMISAVLFLIAGILFLLSYIHIQNRTDTDNGPDSNGDKEPPKA